MSKSIFRNFLVFTIFWVLLTFANFSLSLSQDTVWKLQPFVKFCIIRDYSQKSEMLGPDFPRPKH